jgi:hypothetical protein
MSRRTLRVAFLTTATLPLLLAGAVMATPFHLHEDFSSTRYRDPALNTAWWDTMAGELKLYPLEATVLGTADTPDNAYAVALDGTYAYVADNTSGLQVVDIASPGQPEIVGSWNSPGNGRDVLVVDGLAYLADGSSGLQILDLGTPTAPQLIGSFTAEGFVHGVAVTGHHAFLAQSGAGLRAVDVMDPGTPIAAGILDSDGWAEDVAVFGELACLADGNAGLLVVDISDPNALVAVGVLDTPGYARGVAFLPPYAYVADGDSGLVIVDLTSAATPVLRGRALVPGNANDVVVAGDRAYVAAGGSGLQIVDISQRDAPFLLGGRDTGGDGRGLAVAAGLAYLADGSLGLRILELAPAGFDTVQNLGHSRVIDTSTDPIVRASLTAVQTDSIRWELSADGLNWQEFPPDGSWQTFDEPGQSLFWRSTHVAQIGGGNPTCTQLDLAWDKSLSYPQILSILDVPGDTGGWVRLTFAASRFDVVDSPQPITEYSVFRRYDPGPVMRDGEQPGGESAGGKLYPPGSWDFLLAIPADVEATYSSVLPTLWDATPEEGLRWSVFFIRARTAIPGTYYDSPPDSGYSQDNNLPSIPTGLTVAYGGNGNTLAWDPSPDPDFLEFHIYRGSDPGFIPGPASLVHVTVATIWLDVISPGWGQHYKLTAVNGEGAESVAATPLAVTDVPGRPPWSGPRLDQNMPNPCNPGTLIRYHVPAPGRVRLDLYDLSGRLVRSLVHGSRPAGEQAVFWSGNDDAGRPVASGIYVYVLTTPAGPRAPPRTVTK